MPSKDLTRAQCLERMPAPLGVRAQLGHKPRECGQLAETLRFVKKAGRRGGRRAGYMGRWWVGGGWWRGGGGSGYRGNIRAGYVGGCSLGGSSFFRRCGNPTPTAAAAAAAAAAWRNMQLRQRYCVSAFEANEGGPSACYQHAWQGAAAMPWRLCREIDRAARAETGPFAARETLDLV